MSERFAQAALGTSGTGAAASWLVHANEVVQLGAGLVAIVSGLAAAVYYIAKYLRERR